MAATIEGRAPAPFGPARALSFVVALGVSGVLLIDPYVLGPQLSWRIHAGLPPLMLGVSILFAHAVGFKPDAGALRAAFHPLVGWLLLDAGAAILAAG
jgi:predicted membrane protein